MKLCSSTPADVDLNELTARFGQYLAYTLANRFHQSFGPQSFVFSIFNGQALVRLPGFQ